MTDLPDAPLDEESPNPSSPVSDEMPRHQRKGIVHAVVTLSASGDRYLSQMGREELEMAVADALDGSLELERLYGDDNYSVIVEVASD